MSRITIPVMAIEFDEGGHTIWIHGKGGTVARIKTMGKIKARACSVGAVSSHFDIIVKEDIRICLMPEDAEGLEDTHGSTEPETVRGED